MATSRSRAAATKAPAAKKATVNKKAAAPAKKAAAPKKAAPKNAAAPKKAAPNKAAPAKRAAAPKKAVAAKNAAAPKKAAPAKNASASRNASAPKKVAARNAGRNAASKAVAPKKAAPANKAAAPRAIAPKKATAPARKAKSRGLDPQNDLELILQDLLKDIYYAEKKLVRALGKMAKHATHDQLREAFTTHQTQTEDQVARLEQAFSSMGIAPKAKKCAAMDGLLEEADEHMSEYHKGAGLDAALIVGAQKVEHYEIAAYGSMRSIARSLGHADAAEIFESIREQESDTDELLTQLAESLVNRDAEASHEDTDDSGNSDAATGSRSNKNNNSGGNSGSRGSDAGSFDSDAGEDSSSAVTTRGASQKGADSDSYYEDVSAVESDIENDGTGRGAITNLTDGNDRGEASETGEAMGY